jgi:hypothetical protein
MPRSPAAAATEGLDRLKQMTTREAACRRSRGELKQDGDHGPAHDLGSDGSG